MKSWLVLIILSTQLFAETFRIEGKFFDFKEKDGLLLKGCEKTCDALTTIQKFRKIDLKQVRQGIKHHGSIGSDVCAHTYKGTAALGVNDEKDGRAFCIFKDESMVEINSLS